MTSTPVARPAPRAFDRDHRSVTVGLLALVTMFAFEAVAVSLAMPRVAHALDGETLYPIGVIGMLTAAIVGMVVGGIRSDARGPGCRCWPVASVSCGLLLAGLATSMEVFVLGRLLPGPRGSELALTAMYVAVGDAYPAVLRPRSSRCSPTAWVLPSVAGRSSRARWSTCWAGARCSSSWRCSRWCAPSSCGRARPAISTSATGPLVWGRRPAYALLAAAGAVLLHVAGQGRGPGQVLLLLVGAAAVASRCRRCCRPGTLRARQRPAGDRGGRGVFGAALRVPGDVHARSSCRTRAGSPPRWPGW